MLGIARCESANLDAVTPTTPKLTIEHLTDPSGTHTFRLSGDASVGEVPALERGVTRLIAGLPERLIVDLTGLEFASSLAIGQIMGLLQSARTKQRRAVVVSPAGSDIHGVLTRSRTGLLAPIVDTVADAQARLDEPEPA